MLSFERLYKTVTILYLVLFSIYVLFSRQPDYFDAEFTKGIIVEKQALNKSVQYIVGREIFTIPIKGWGASQVAAGQVVKVIYNPSTPAEGALYSFFAYWFTLPELLTSSIVYIILFFAAVFITGKEDNYYYTDEDKQKKKRYKD